MNVVSLGEQHTQPANLRSYGWLSLAAAVFTLLLKTYAYWLTDSVGLLSDAAESLINLTASIILLVVLNISSRPPDENHAYGHEKIEYFSSGAEGVLIILAAIAIAATAIDRLLHPQALQRLDFGIGVSIVASIVNLIVARVLIGAGNRYCSIALEADGRHLMTDVWTTLGILIGLAMIFAFENLPYLATLGKSLGFSSWQFLDSIIALGVALHIVLSGVHLLRRTTAGLMDEALPQDELQAVIEILDRFQVSNPIAYHALRTRYAGAKRFVSFHLLVPGNWSVQQGHDLIEAIEQEIKTKFDVIDLDTHLEPIEDLASWLH